MKKLAFLILIFMYSFIGYSQDFLDDKTMKLEEISEDNKYGFKSKAKNSIKVGTIPNEYKYINALTGPNGEPIQAQRLGSCCSFKSKTAMMGRGLLDMWEITYEGLDKPIVIYLNGYEYEKPKCPKGLSFKRI